VPLRLDDFVVSEPDQAELAALFGELEFTSLLSEFVKRPGTPKKTTGHS